METNSASNEAINMIRESAAGIAERQDLNRIRALRGTTTGMDHGTWKAMCDMGWLGLRIAEEKGGVGLGMNACCALMEELGAALVPEPLIGAMLALQAADTHLPDAVLSGESIVLPAWQERSRSLEGAAATTIRDGRAFGTKSYIAMAESADAFLVLTQQGWARVERHAPGLVLETAATQDGGHYGTLRLEGAAAQILAATDAKAPIAEATLATAAYLLGLGEEAFTRTLDYLRTRVQFGKPLGSFQALQHRAVDLKLELALTRASIGNAARLWDEAPASHAAFMAISRAKIRASETAMLVTRQAIQMHGGIGYTDEHDIGLYLRKAMVMAPAYGDARLHRARFAALTLDQENEAA